jgi:hypothetical protein
MISSHGGERERGWLVISLALSSYSENNQELVLQSIKEKKRLKYFIIVRTCAVVC